MIQARRTARSLLSLLGVFLASSCSQTPSATATSALLPSTSTQQIFAAVSAVPSSVRYGVFTEVAALSLPQYEALLGQAMSDDPVIIDGQTFRDAKSNLAEAHELFLTLGDEFQTIGEFWQVSGIDPRGWTYKNYKTEFDEIVAGMQAGDPEASAQLALSSPVAPTGYQRYAVETTPGDFCDYARYQLGQLMGVDLDHLLVQINQAQTWGEVPGTDGINPHVGRSNGYLQLGHQPKRPDADATLLLTRSRSTYDVWHPYSDHNQYRDYCTTTNPDHTPDAKAPPATNSLFTPDPDFWNPQPSPPAAAAPEVAMQNATS